MGCSTQVYLSDQVRPWQVTTDKKQGFWPTPASRDYKGAVAPETLEAKGRNETNSLGDAIGEGGQQGSLNPDWVEWLMGIPIGWTDIDCDEPQEHLGWDEDPAEFFPTKAASERGPHSVGKENIPRLTTVKKNRVNRLKACGNGVVPQQAALALRILLHE